MREWLLLLVLPLFLKLKGVGKPTSLRGHDAVDRNNAEERGTPSLLKAAFTDLRSEMSVEALTKLASTLRDKLVAAVMKWWRNIWLKEAEKEAITTPTQKIASTAEMEKFDTATVVWKEKKDVPTLATKTDTVPDHHLSHEEYLKGKFGANFEQIMEIANRKSERGQLVDG
uniref:RxLR effector candidate protein n=1 Tax=Hyaloperonospora arabidopsidis (strain Emoy2) TaxID=559515 RepID=M4BLI5_HYAAE